MLCVFGHFGKGGESWNFRVHPLIPPGIYISQLVTVDHSARGTMKNAAICGNRLPRRFWFMTDVSNAHCAHSHETSVAVNGLR